MIFIKDILSFNLHQKSSLYLQNSMKLLEITKPRRITCHTALESWRSILFWWKSFLPPSKVLYLLFFAMSKNCDFLKNLKKFFAHGKKGGKKLLRGVKNFFIKKYGPLAFQRRVARYSTRLTYFWNQFWNLPQNPKKKV